jgi:NTP pyrophosphatase (non-canonical NTP hydrolase)
MKHENKTNLEKIRDIAKKNTLDYDYAKLAEECTELTDALIKMITKPNRREERMPHLIEEMGDVQLRLSILREKLGCSAETGQRFQLKLDYLSGKLQQGKYENY